MTVRSMPVGPTAAPLQSSLQAAPLWKVYAVALVAVMVFSAGNLMDPIMRYDDFPALFAEPDGFWSKTLSEGRWLNYFWHMRGVVTPAWLNFAIYQAVWALFAAAFAVAVIPGPARIWFSCVLALTVLVAPPALLMASWFNTLLPGTLLLAIYAILSTRLSQFSLRALLPIFTFITLSAYTTFPIILLMICLVRTKRHSIKDLAGLIVLFGASFILSLLAIYAINWQVHGVFGVSLDPSRSPNPAHSLAEMATNFELWYITMGIFAQKMSFNSGPVIIFHLLMLVSATVVIARRSPLEALYLHAGLWIGMTLITLQVFKLGVTIPIRACAFAWISYAVLIVRAAEILSDTTSLPGRLARNAVLLITVSYLLQTAIQYTQFRDWQAETKSIAHNLAMAPGPVYAIGDILNHPAAYKASAQKPIALQYRIRQLTGRQIIICDNTPDACPSVPKEWLAPETFEKAKMRLEQLDGATFIVLPPTDRSTISHIKTQ